MDTRSLLQKNCERLLEQYETNLKVVQELQYTMVEDVLPSVADELGLDSEQINWAKQWLEDAQAIFQLLRRDNFTRAFAMESIRKNLLWRFKKLWPSEPELSLSRVYFLPLDVRDPLGRPIIVIRASNLKDSSETYNHLLIRTMEQFRLCLKTLNDASDQTPVVLQYTVLLDVKELSMQTLSIDLISWVLRDLIPRFPGMLAAVFIINSSWAHSGMWNIVKRVLPNSAVSRVFFSSPNELVSYFAPSSLPKDYGGCLPPLSSISPAAQWTPSASSELSTKAHATSVLPSPIYLSPTSLLNPFFGYPASSSQGSLILPHGRRRKRDLLRTLAVLFWLRWRRPIATCFWLAGLVFAGRMWKWLLNSPSGSALLKSWRISSMIW